MPEQTYREALRDGMAEEKRQQAVRVAAFAEPAGHVQHAREQMRRRKEV